MAYGYDESNGHVTLKGLGRAICLGPNISKTTGDAILATIANSSDSLASCFVIAY